MNQTLNRTSRCNKVDAGRLEIEFTFTEGSEVRVSNKKGRSYNSEFSNDATFVQLYKGVVYYSEGQ